jgi:hypothetical protein
MSRSAARDLLASRYPRFRFIGSNCMRIDYPKVPGPPYQRIFGPLACPGEGEDVYHAYSVARYANVRVFFREDRVTRVQLEAGTGYIG